MRDRSELEAGKYKEDAKGWYWEDNKGNRFRPISFDDGKVIAFNSREAFKRHQAKLINKHLTSPPTIRGKYVRREGSV